MTDVPTVKHFTSQDQLDLINAKAAAALDCNVIDMPVIYVLAPVPNFVALAEGEEHGKHAGVRTMIAEAATVHTLIVLNELARKVAAVHGSIGYNSGMEHTRHMVRSALGIRQEA
jgi:hypothetical protein